MALSPPNCDLCSRKQLSLVAAIKYCTDCEVNLCMDCVSSHNLFKSLSSHNLIDSRSLPIETLFVQNSCAKHEKVVLEFFCVQHDCLCCRVCMAETHMNCEQIVHVDDASNGVQRSPMLEDLFSTTYSIHETLEKLINNRDENLKSLEDEEADILRNVSRIKSKILLHLDDLERKIISDMKALKSKCENQIKFDKAILSKMLVSLDEVTSKLNIASEHGLENQLFILLNSYKWKVSDYDIKIQEIIASTFTCKLWFHQSPLIESFGTVQIKSIPCPIKYKATKSKHAQDLPTIIRMPTQFKFDFKFDIKSADRVCVTSIAVTDDNQLLLCNRYSTKLLVYNERGEFIQYCTLSSPPWNVAIIQGECKAVVSLPWKSSIQFIDIKALKSGRTHSVPDTCYGIAVVGYKIYVGGDGKIYILNKQGKLTTTLSVPCVSTIFYLHPGPEDSIYFTDHLKVGCFNISGELRSTCTPENFKAPQAVVTDRGGNLYIACYNTNNIHRLSAEWIAIDIILDNTRKISNPYGLAFSKNYDHMFVTNDYGKSVDVFSCL